MIKDLAIILISLVCLTTGCVEKEVESISTVPPEEETISGPVLIINHLGESRSATFQTDDEISGQVSVSFSDNKKIEGTGYGIFESTKITVENPSISSYTIQEIMFDVQGKMTDDCEMEITIIEDRFPGTITSGYSYDNYPQRGRPGEHSVESFAFIAGSEFNEGSFTIPFKGMLYTTKTTRDYYEWTWTFQLSGFEDKEEVHDCVFALE